MGYSDALRRKILLYDIETTPLLAWVWGTYKQNVIRVHKNWELLSVAYKWLGGKSHFISRQTMSEKELVKSVWKLHDEAEIVIGHNSIDFDDKKCFAKYAQFRMKPPSPFLCIDTKREAASVFRFYSNRLNDLGEILEIGKKVDTGGFDLWLGCMNGDPESWKKMRRYNLQDLNILEKAYKKLRPWMRRHPNITIRGIESCPKCSGTRLYSRGWKHNTTQSYRLLRCQDCGAYCRDVRRDKTLAKALVTP